MPARLPALAPLLVLAFALPALSDDSGRFVITLGRDTTAVEEHRRAPDRVEVRQIARAPRVLERQFTYQYTGGRITAFRMVVTPAGATAPTQTIDATFDADSARVRTQSGSAPVQNATHPFPPGSVVVAASSPWASYEGLLTRLVAEKRDSLRTPMYLVGAAGPGWVLLQRLGRDSVAISNSRQDRYHARVDGSGRILGVRPLAGTQRVGVERAANLDVAAAAAAFVAREQAGTGLGTLSPRDSVVTTVAGASLWIDYGRPGKRGRVIFGEVVPFGEVWRTGANAATQFRTDRALDFGGTVVPPGFYTLWTVPSPRGWTLRFNGETGQWGTAHKPEKDLFTVDMKVESLPQVVERFTIGVAPAGEGGILTMDWDTTRASVAFSVRP